MFVLTSCLEDGCIMPEKLFISAGSYRQHRMVYHSGRYPTTCTFPGCLIGEKRFNSSASYHRHLVDHHALTTAKMRAPYYPKDTKSLEAVKKPKRPREISEDHDLNDEKDSDIAKYKPQTKKIKDWST